MKLLTPGVFDQIKAIQDGAFVNGKMTTFGVFVIVHDAVITFCPLADYGRQLVWVGGDGGRDFVGKWRVHDDMLCLEVPQFDNELCRTVIVRGDLLFLFTQTGEPAGRIDVTKGNPDHY